MAVLLLVIGGAALYIELHAPGIGIGGFVAAVCFLLFFWSRYLGGTAGWLEVSLFVAGVSCLLLEVFVIPGFGIFGLGGGALVLASLVLASQTFLWPRNEYQFEQLETLAADDRRGGRRGDRGRRACCASGCRARRCSAA